MVESKQECCTKGRKNSTPDSEPLYPGHLSLDCLVRFLSKLAGKRGSLSSR